jgi:NADH pyrophosphatase NudC (nudix superfamily)
LTSRSWRLNEIKVLKIYSGSGPSVLASLLDRTPGSIKSKAHQLNITLTDDGDDIEIAKAENLILDRIRKSPTLMICPMCGLRLAIIQKTGMCRVCHLDQLIQLRETQLSELEREKRLTMLRQEKARLRICSNCLAAHYPKTSSKANLCRSCGGS